MASAALLVVAPVPPWVIDRAVVRPLKALMSEFAPDFAAPRLVRAFPAVEAPVPPILTPRGVEELRSFKLIFPASTSSVSDWFESLNTAEILLEPSLIGRISSVLLPSDSTLTLDNRLNDVPLTVLLAALTTH